MLKLILAVVFVALSSVASAEDNATLVMKSGQHISGQLVELGGLDFIVKVSGSERLVPARDVAVIEFSSGEMTASDWAKIADGPQAVWLKSGEIIIGQLYDISGSSPLKITFQTSTGTREFSSQDVGRIVLARPTSAIIGTPALPR